MFKQLDPLLHSQLRLAIVSLLISVQEAEFTFLKEKTGATAGNISVQLNKLKIIMDNELATYNEMIRKSALPIIGVKAEEGN